MSATTYDLFRYSIGLLFIFIVGRTNLEFGLDTGFTLAFGATAAAKAVGFALDQRALVRHRCQRPRRHSQIPVRYFLALSAEDIACL
jgi:hypothetical protein